jgi:NADH dehydrogenase FAD-containing subunit
MSAAGGAAARKRVVFLGAGHAHLYALKRTGEFVRRGHEVVAVAPDLFWYSGLATGMLGGIYPPELDRVDVAALVERGGGRFVRDAVAGLDPTTGTVRLVNAGEPLRYDVLSLTLGSEAPGIPGASGEAMYAVKPVRRLCELHVDLRRRFRGAAAADGADRAVRVLVAGGGVTACELAANIARLAAADGGPVEITVVVGGGEALKQLPRRSAARKVVAALEQRGVVFRYGSRVERIDGTAAVLTDGSMVPFDVFVNATGLKPASLVRKFGLPVDPEGALIVDEHLRSVADPTVHGGGDCIAVRGRELPKVGVYAIRQAPVLFRNLLAALDGKPPASFRPQRKFLWIMNLGDGTGLAARGSLYWHGRIAFWLKDWIDRRFLREYRSAEQ